MENLEYFNFRVKVHAENKICIFHKNILKKVIELRILLKKKTTFYDIFAFFF